MFRLTHGPVVAVTAPPDAPAAANIKAPAARGLGVSAALWAGPDRTLAQAWAQALHRAGWLAVHSGISHDPAGAQRAVTLFDLVGQHAPYDDPAWGGSEHTLHDDAHLRAQLRRYGISVTTSEVDLPVLSLADSGLLG